MDNFDPLPNDFNPAQDFKPNMSGNQNVKFYNKKCLSYRAKKGEDGKYLIDPKTGQPFKEAFEETKVFIRVETKGDTNIKDDVADDYNKWHFGRQYKAFLNNTVPDGKPIEDFEFFHPGTLIELRMMGIYVIEQVAAMSDVQCEQLRGQPGFDIRDIGQQWLRMMSPSGQAAKAQKLEHELAEANRKIAALEAGSQGSKVIKRLVEQPAAPEMEVPTLELTPEQFAKARKKGK